MTEGQTNSGDHWVTDREVPGIPNPNPITRSGPLGKDVHTSTASCPDSACLTNIPIIVRHGKEDKCSGLNYVAGPLLRIELSWAWLTCEMFFSLGHSLTTWCDLVAIRDIQTSSIVGELWGVGRCSLGLQQHTWVTRQRQQYGLRIPRLPTNCKMSETGWPC